MQRRRFGPSSIELPVIGQGTWQMEHDDRNQAIAAIRAGLDAGMTHIDTAEMYGSGEVEGIVAEAIAGRRDEVFLVSKVLPQNASRRGTIAACEQSLRRLRTERLDLYLLHWPGSHPLEDTIAAFEELVQKGKIRSYGVSNFDVDELEQALDVAGEGKLLCNQVLYHLEERRIERRLMPFCEEHGIAVVAYSPFGSGRFPSPRSAGGRLLEQIARAHGATARQVALRFLVRNENVFAIPKASSAAHVRDNAGAGDVELTADELSLIDRTFPVGRLGRGLPTL